MLRQIVNIYVRRKGRARVQDPDPHGSNPSLIASRFRIQMPEILWTLKIVISLFQDKYLISKDKFKFEKIVIHFMFV